MVVVEVVEESVDDVLLLLLDASEPLPKPCAGSDAIFPSK